MVGELKRVFGKISFKKNQQQRWRQQIPQGTDLSIPSTSHLTPEETQTLRQMIQMQSRIPNNVCIEMPLLLCFLLAFIY